MKHSYVIPHCRNCGAQLNTDDRICAHCGEPVAGIWPPHISGHDDSAPPKKLLTNNEISDRLVGALGSLGILVGSTMAAYQLVLAYGMDASPSFLIGTVIILAVVKKCKLTYPNVSKALLAALQVAWAVVALSVLGAFVVCVSWGLGNVF